MPQVKSVLLIPNANVDIPTWSWALVTETNFLDHKLRWSKELLVPQSPLAVVVSLPSRTWRQLGGYLCERWDHEKKTLGELFENMRRQLGLNINGPFDLTALTGQKALCEMEQIFCNYEQVIGIAHVPERVCPDCGHELVSERCEVCGKDFWRCPACRAQLYERCPQCGREHERSRGSSYFELGQGGRLDSRFLKNIAAKIRATDSPGRRALFLGCKTLATDLPRTFVEEGLALAYLKTVKEEIVDDMLILLRATVVAGYGERARNILDKLWSAYQKMLGFKTEEASLSGLPCRFALVIEGSPPLGGGEYPYYLVKACPEGGLPHLNLYRRREEMLGKLVEEWAEASTETIFVVDVPVALRTEVRKALQGRPLLFVAMGATCDSVARALFAEGVEYHLGCLHTASSFLIYRMLLEYFTCISVEDFSLDAWQSVTSLAPSMTSHGQNFWGLLLDMARKKIVVVGARP